MDWMLMPLRRYADFSGRSRRKEYWMYTLFNILVFLVLTVVASLGLIGMNEQHEPGVMLWIGMGLMVLFALATLVPSIAVQVRRFHDQGKSGWFVLFNLIPYVGGFVVLVFMLLEGMRAANQYGPPVK